MGKQDSVMAVQILNYLTVVSLSHKDKRHRKWYNTICVCGKEKIIMGAAMKSGNTKSCGCLSKKMRTERNLLPDNLGTKRQIILQYKRHAKGRGLAFDISENDFIPLLTNNCNYCGRAPSNIKRTKNNKTGIVYSGVDRVDSAKGYSRQNCVSCCDFCNKAKGNRSLDEFRKWISQAYTHMAQQWGDYLLQQP